MRLPAKMLAAAAAVRAVGAKLREGLHADALKRLDIIDVSGYQPVIRWDEVAASGVAGAYVKATEGRTWASPTCAEHTRCAREAGLRVGHYHFARLQGRSGLEPETQAQQFHRVSGGWRPGDLPPVLDLEWAGTRLKDGTHVDSADAVAWVMRWMREAEALFGVRPIIYTGPSFWSGVMDNATELADEALWVVDYRKASRVAGRPKLPRAWDRWVLWQYTGKGRTPGVYRKDGVTLADCDRNYLRGGPVALALLCRDHLKEGAA